MVRASLLYFLLMFCVIHTATGRPEGAADGDYMNDNEEYNYDDEGEDEVTPTQSNLTPVFTSAPLTLNAKPGETVFLPCNIRNLSSNYAVMWQNGTNMLYSDSVKAVDNPRIYRFENFTLQIQDIKAEDSGVYTCSVSTVPRVELIHQLLVPSPAQIVKLLPDVDHRTVLLNSSLTLQCEATGHPEPQVTWTKPGSVMPNGKEAVKKGNVHISSVKLEHAGSYECTATNGLGHDDVRRVTIHVQYAPTIQVMKEVVNSGVGYMSELQCKVEALPLATVTWAKSGKPLSSNSHVKMDVVGDLHTLRITKTKKEDFATYTCGAQNSVGAQTAAIELTGVPSIAKFITSNSTGNSVTLQWVVDSHAPITEYNLRYRKTKTHEWRTENPIVEDPVGNQYQVIHTLTGLAPGDYEVTLSSKNSYGSSRGSATQYFNIKDYGEAAPSKVEDKSDPASNAVDTRPVFVLLLSLLTLQTLLQ